MQVFEYVVVGINSQRQKEIVAGPDAVLAENAEHAKKIALAEFLLVIRGVRGVSDEELQHLEVLVRPFVRTY